MVQLSNVLKGTNPVEAVQAAPGTSERFGFVNSRELLSTFQDQGWQVNSTSYANVRKVERAGFQKHLIWLTNPAFDKIPGLSTDNESAIRLCFYNAHDCTSALQVFLGIMRTACANQLLTGSIFRYFRAVHSKSIVSKLSTGIDYVTQGIPELVDNIQRLQALQLNASQRGDLARLVLPARFENVNGFIDADYSVIENVVRGEDHAQDAYTVANRLQESLIRGGVPYIYERNVKNNEGLVIGKTLVHTKTRKVGSIVSQIKLNKALFDGIKSIAAA